MGTPAVFIILLIVFVFIVNQNRFKIGVNYVIFLRGAKHTNSCVFCCRCFLYGVSVLIFDLIAINEKKYIVYVVYTSYLKYQK